MNQLFKAFSHSIAFLTLFLIAGRAHGQVGQASLSSPNGLIQMTFHTGPSGADQGALYYQVTYKGKPLIDSSALYLDFVGEKPLGQTMRIVKVTPGSDQQRYRLAHGKISQVDISYHTLSIELQESNTPSRKLILEARAYDDAVAFRYVVPEQAGMTAYKLHDEQTEFRISKDAITYALELPNFRSMYESEFIKLPITAFSNQGGVKSSVLLGLPLLMEVPGVAWAAIAEADLRGYSSMYLTNPSGTWTGHWLESKLAPQVESPNVAVTGTLPLHSAWRTVLIADQPGKLVESNVITSLNPPLQFTDTAWVKAGKAAWDWWGGNTGKDGKPDPSTENMKYYIDFAAQSGLEYMLIDAGWAVGSDVTKLNGKKDIPALAQYAQSKNVKLWIWASYTSLKDRMEEAFALFEKWGVVGVKTDFIERDDQKGMEFYYQLAECGAKHHIMVDFHGATKPSGIERSYPNVIGYESVLGMEQSKGGMRDNPDHHVMLPFTRMLLGLMDYTPGGFDNVTREAFVPKMQGRPSVLGTRAHHLAIYAVYEAPFQMVSDVPSAYEGDPSFQFIRDIPSSWDESHMLNGIPGEYVTMARRQGRDWFLGSMTNWNARDLDIHLTFLGTGNYKAQIYADAPDAADNPKKVVIEEKNLRATDTLHLHLVSGGGCAVRFIPD